MSATCADSCSAGGASGGGCVAAQVRKDVLDHCEQQLLTVAEVVAHQRRVDAGLARDQDRWGPCAVAVSPAAGRRGDTMASRPTALPGRALGRPRLRFWRLAAADAFLRPAGAGGFAFHRFVAWHKAGGF